MLSLIYVSSAVRPYSTPDLLDILEQARPRNASLDVTGMLLYQSASFLQVLEGPEPAVRGLFATISVDPRHRNVQILIERPTDERDFANWSMGFHDLADPVVRETPGFSDYLTLPLDSEDYRNDPSLARRLLSIFRRNMKT